MAIYDLLKKLFAPHPTGAFEGAAKDGAEGVTEGEDVDPFDPFPEPVRLEIKDVFDLHSIPPRDAQRVVIEYLEQARRAGFLQLRIIHGKGIGAQRETVRSVLAATPFVERFTDAPHEAGGWGATVVRLAPEKDAPED